jgi:phosphoribosylformylglycinamidine cyclo-ligase
LIKVISQATKFPDYLTQDERVLFDYARWWSGYKVFLGVHVLEGNRDISVWKGIAQDALIMNIDDLLCVGATDNISLHHRKK